MLAQNYNPSTEWAHLKRAGTSPADVEIRQIVARPFLLLSSIMISFYSCWLLLSAPVRPNLLKESNRGGKHTRQESQLEMERLEAKYCWCSHENTVDAHMKILLMLTWKYCWCLHENTVDAYMKILLVLTWNPVYENVTERRRMRGWVRREKKELQ